LLLVGIANPTHPFFAIFAPLRESILYTTEKRTPRQTNRFAK